jgi:hypothetical protein
MPESNVDKSSLGRRMSDVGGLKITKAKKTDASMGEVSLPEGWSMAEVPSPYSKKAHREGQHDKSAMLDAEMNPPDEADMSEDEYEYWKSACSSCASMAEGDGKKYTHTYKDSKTGKTRKVRYGAQGYKIAPGTKRGDSYCARSLGDMKSEGMDCSGGDKNTPMCLSRKKWKCKGSKSTG